MKQAISLSPISRNHLQKMLAWRNDPKIYKWCRQYEPISETSHYAWFDRIQGDQKIKMYAIYESDCFVGVAGLTDIDYINSRAEFSLYIGPDYHGNGLGKQALGALLKHGFHVLNLNMIWGETFEGNRALKTFKSLGFKIDGTRRAFYFREGKYIDCTLVSILRSEFNE